MTASPCLVSFLSYFDYGALSRVNRHWKASVAKCKVPSLTWQMVWEEVFAASDDLVQFAKCLDFEECDPIVFNVWGATDRRFVIGRITSGFLSSELTLHRFCVHKPCSMTWERVAPTYARHGPPCVLIKSVPIDREVLQRFVRRQTGGHYSVDMF